MQTGRLWVSLVVLGWAGSLQGVVVLPAPLYPTQENFDLARFMGKWHDIVVASTCPYMQRHKGQAAIGSLELEKADAQGKVKMTRKSLRHGTCKLITGEYDLTDTPGRFSYHVAKWGADVDAYVVHTNYNEYAIVIMSKQKQAGQKSVSLKLYSRTMEVRPTVLEDFKRLVREQSMSDDTVVIKQNKGMDRHSLRSRRNVILSPALVPEEGSGDDTPLFKGEESCKTEPDVGPCFGMFPRYFFNSTAMACQLFNYGGCMGNQNNFLTERQCLQSCRTEAACRLPYVATPCEVGQPREWFFNQGTGLCMALNPGLCQRNSNRFYTKGECEEYCGVVKEEGEFLKAN
ncbi:protein AMBP [Aplochiton taeniatus]